MSVATGRLYSVLVERLRDRTDLALSLTLAFADLLWDADLSASEVMALDAAVVVDSKTSGRRIVAQEIRGQLRYWLTTDRDPYALSTNARTELGSVSAIDDLVQLCVEFLVEGASLSELSSARDVVRS